LYICAVVFFVLTTFDLYEYYSTEQFVDEGLREQFRLGLGFWASCLLLSAILMLTLVFTFYAMRTDIPRKLKVGEIMIWWAMALSVGSLGLDEMFSLSTVSLSNAILFQGYMVLVLLAAGCALMKWGSPSNKTAEG